MWHLFDKYKGIVWPKSGQMNLIARILNNLCPGPGIKLNTPTVPSPASPVTISVDEDWLDGKIGGEGSGAGVESVNAEDGALTVNGGKNIRVNTAGKVITISYDEGKDPDESAVVEDTAGCNEWADEGGGGGGGGSGGGGGGGGGWFGEGGEGTDEENNWSEDSTDDGENGWGQDRCAEINGW